MARGGGGWRVLAKYRGGWPTEGAAVSYIVFLTHSLKIKE